MIDPQNHPYKCKKHTHHHQERINHIVADLYKIKTPAFLIQTIANQLINYYGFGHTQIRTNANNLINKFINSQDKIGWDHFIRGRISTKINDVIHYAYKNKTPSPNFSIQTWKNKLCKILIYHHIHTWKQYCEYSHKDNFNRQPFLFQVQTLKDKSTQIPLPHDINTWFQADSETLGQMSKAQIQNWITHAISLLKKYTRHNSHNQPLITQIFGKKLKGPNPAPIITNQQVEQHATAPIRHHTPPPTPIEKEQPRNAHTITKEEYPSIKEIHQFKSHNNESSHPKFTYAQKARNTVVTDPAEKHFNTTKTKYELLFNQKQSLIKNSTHQTKFKKDNKKNQKQKNPSTKHPFNTTVDLKKDKPWIY